MNPSLPPVHLTDSQLRQFRDEGYVFLGPVLGASELDELRREEARFRANREAAKSIQPHQTLFFSQVCPYSEVVRRVGTTGPHLAAMEQLIGSNLLLWFTQFVTKLPDGHSGKSEFPWHQDNGYVSISPANNVTLWIALDDVDTANGCVWVVPRSHLQGLLPHRKKSADSWFLELQVEGDGLPAVMKAGEGIAFTGLTLHRSKLNQTERPRRAFFFEYCDPSAIATPVGDSGEAASSSPVIKRPGTWLVKGQVPLPADAQLNS